MNNSIIEKWAARFAALAVTTAVAAVPFLAAAPAEAQTYDRTQRVYRGMQTLTGRVVDDYSNNAFLLRLSNGRQVRVKLMGKEPRTLGRRDRVRVTGFLRNGTFHAQRWSILRNR